MKIIYFYFSSKNIIKNITKNIILVHQEQEQLFQYGQLILVRVNIILNCVKMVFLISSIFVHFTPQLIPPSTLVSKIHKNSQEIVML